VHARSRLFAHGLRILVTVLRLVYVRTFTGHTLRCFRHAFYYPRFYAPPLIYRTHTATFFTVLVGHTPPPTTHYVPPRSQLHAAFGSVHAFYALAVTAYTQFTHVGSVGLRLRLPFCAGLPHGYATHRILRGLVRLVAAHTPATTIPTVLRSSWFLSAGYLYRIWLLHTCTVTAGSVHAVLQLVPVLRTVRTPRLLGLPHTPRFYATHTVYTTTRLHIHAVTHRLHTRHARTLRTARYGSTAPGSGWLPAFACTRLLQFTTPFGLVTQFLPLVYCVYCRCRIAARFHLLHRFVLPVGSRTYRYLPHCLHLPFSTVLRFYCLHGCCARAFGLRYTPGFGCIHHHTQFHVRSVAHAHQRGSRLPDSRAARTTRLDARYTPHPGPRTRCRLRFGSRTLRCVDYAFTFCWVHHMVCCRARFARLVTRLPLHATQFFCLRTRSPAARFMLLVHVPFTHTHTAHAAPSSPLRTFPAPIPRTPSPRILPHGWVPRFSSGLRLHTGSHGYFAFPLLRSSRGWLYHSSRTPVLLVYYVYHGCTHCRLPQLPPHRGLCTHARAALTHSSHRIITHPVYGSPCSLPTHPYYFARLTVPFALTLPVGRSCLHGYTGWLPRLVAHATLPPQFTTFTIRYVCGLQFSPVTRTHAHAWLRLQFTFTHVGTLVTAGLRTLPRGWVRLRANTSSLPPARLLVQFGSSSALWLRHSHALTAHAHVAYHAVPLQFTTPLRLRFCRTR